MLAPGTLLDDRFEVVAFIGEGRSSAVYRARHRVTHEQVALRIVSPWIVTHSLSADPRFIDRFRETIAPRQIQNEHVIEIAEVVYRDEHLFLVTELVESPLELTHRTWP